MRADQTVQILFEVGSYRTVVGYVVIDTLVSVKYNKTLKTQPLCLHESKLLLNHSNF